MHSKFLVIREIFGFKVNSPLYPTLYRSELNFRDAAWSAACGFPAYTRKLEVG
jgi:hypothetical protein